MITKNTEMNKLIVDNTEYELIENGGGLFGSTPTIVINGKCYYGKAIPNKPKKDYEILSFEKDGIVFSKSERTGRFGLMALMEETCFERGAEINSVKRLSDNEVFTVGDRIENVDNSIRIDAFVLNFKGNDLWVSIDVNNGYGCSLDVAKKVKQPILTTEDGKPYYEYEDVWVVNSAFAKPFLHATDLDGYNERKTHFKYFSSYELAEEYIMVNAPVYSYKEICDILFVLSGSISYEGKGLIISQLLKLGKQKLNAQK